MKSEKNKKNEKLHIFTELLTASITRLNQLESEAIGKGNLVKKENLL